MLNVNSLAGANSFALANAAQTGTEEDMSNELQKDQLNV
jgi:hypothetical protein